MTLPRRGQQYVETQRCVGRPDEGLACHRVIGAVELVVEGQRRFEFGQGRNAFEQGVKIGGELID